MASSTVQFPIHTLESAPAGSRLPLEKLKASVGMIPNLAGAMSESPVLIEGFESLRSMIRAKGTFSPQEGEAIALVNAVENTCRYCSAIHSTFAIATGLDKAVIAAIRAYETPADPKLGAIVSFARKLVANRGNVADGEVQAFLNAGFTKAHVLELIARLAMSVMANYSAHFTDPTPDDAIKPQYA